MPYWVATHNSRFKGHGKSGLETCTLYDDPLRSAFGDGSAVAWFGPRERSDHHRTVFLFLLFLKSSPIRRVTVADSLVDCRMYIPSEVFIETCVISLVPIGAAGMAVRKMAPKDWFGRVCVPGSFYMYATFCLLLCYARLGAVLGVDYAYFGRLVIFPFVTAIVEFTFAVARTCQRDIRLRCYLSVLEKHCDSLEEAFALATEPEPPQVQLNIERPAGDIEDADLRRSAARLSVCYASGSFVFALLVDIAHVMLP